ncbi:MAG: PDGLE domain-containing protein [Candidatus Nanopelagicus sp.]
MKISNRRFYAGVILISALLAGGVSYYASSSPDGLEKVAEDVGFIETAQDHSFGDFTLADYGFKGLESARLSVGFAGLIGVAATALMALGLFRLIRKKTPNKNQ